MTVLFHLSDVADIGIFRPRQSDYTPDAVVWAIAQSHLANYLLPRDCPRVTFRAGAGSSRQDIDALLGIDRSVVAVEAAWMAEIAAARLYCYSMPAETFTLHDSGAGYWVSRSSVVPAAVETLVDLPAAIAAKGATLRVVSSLWPLHDAVKASSLTFSMIRMRNAAAR